MNTKLSTTNSTFDFGERALGIKAYDLTDHLGNVTTQVSDRKSGTIATNDIKANVLSYQQYYPFGWNQPGRSLNADKARFDFQNQETDKEWLGGNAVAYRYRFHDPRLGRFLSVDPLKERFLYNSSYAFSENRVIDGIELEGRQVVLIPIIIGALAKLGRPVLKGAGRLFRAGAKPKSVPKVKPQAVPKANPTVPKNTIPKPNPKLPTQPTPVPVLPPIGFDDYIDQEIIQDLEKHKPKRDNLTDLEKFIQTEFENTYMYKVGKMEDELYGKDYNPFEDDENEDPELVYQMYGIDKNGKEVTIKYGTLLKRGAMS